MWPNSRALPWRRSLRCSSVVAKSVFSNSADSLCGEGPSRRGALPRRQVRFAGRVRRLSLPGRQTGDFCKGARSVAAFGHALIPQPKAQLGQRLGSARSKHSVGTRPRRCCLCRPCPTHHRPAHVGPIVPTDPTALHMPPRRSNLRPKYGHPKTADCGSAIACVAIQHMSPWARARCHVLSNARAEPDWSATE